MPDQIESSAFADLLINHQPLLDVRAPTEFNRGAIPNALNFPLLDDQQRQAVGVRFKQAGQQAAIELGQELSKHGRIS